MERFLKGASGTPLIPSASSTRQPSKFCSWNCNGFSVRLNTDNKQNLDDFVKFIQNERPDVLTLQEVRMTRASEVECGAIDHSKKSPKCLRSDADLFAMFKRRIPEYTVHLSLAGKKYAGQAIFIHNSLQSPTISFTFDKTGQKRPHDNEGRIIIAEFDHVLCLSTYTPNNGVTEEKFQRRRDWDSHLEHFLTAQRKTGKAIVYQGDLNVAAEEADLSGDPLWWKSQCVLSAQDPNDIGQPGTTVNEQRRFQNILCASGLVDAWRQLHPWTESTNITNRNISAPIFTWRGASGPRYFGKGMRIDYHLVSERLLTDGLLASAVVNGWGTDLQGFMGSDHCPVTVTLIEDWWLKTRPNNKRNKISEVVADEAPQGSRTPLTKGDDDCAEEESQHPAENTNHENNTHSCSAEGGVDMNVKRQKVEASLSPT